MSVGNIILDLFTVVDTIAIKFIIGGYEAIAQQILSFFVPVVAIIIALVGWSLLAGRLSTPFNHMVTLALKVGVVLAFLRHWSFFSELIYEFIAQLPVAITRALAQGIEGSPLALKSSMELAIQGFYDKGMHFAGEMIARASWTSFSPAFLGFLVIVATLIVACYAAFLIVIAKFGLTLCIVLAPIFITTSLFSYTKKLTERWISHLITFTITPIGIMLIVYFVFYLTEYMFNKVAAGGESSAFELIVAYLFVTMLSVPMLIQTKHLMASISSGFSMSSMGFVGGAYNRSLGYMKKQGENAKLKLALQGR